MEGDIFKNLSLILKYSQFCDRRQTAEVSPEFTDVTSGWLDGKLLAFTSYSSLLPQNVDYEHVQLLPIRQEIIYLIV